MKPLFARLESLDKGVTPERGKLHLATPTRERNEPLALYNKGEFDEWQSYQSAKEKTLQQPRIRCRLDRHETARPVPALALCRGAGGCR